MRPLDPHMEGAGPDRTRIRTGQGSGPLLRNAADWFRLGTSHGAFSVPIRGLGCSYRLGWDLNPRAPGRDGCHVFT